MKRKPLQRINPNKSTANLHLMEIIVIAAMAANRVIGKANTIPWHIPGEQQRFKQTTMGHALIMGRKTYESIGMPLPGRRNIIITRNRKYLAQGCEVVHSLQQAYKLCQNESMVFNIGGAELYAQGLDHADTLILTVLDDSYDGDAYFPRINENNFTKVNVININSSPNYSIITYKRIK